MFPGLDPLQRTELRAYQAKRRERFDAVTPAECAALTDALSRLITRVEAMDEPLVNPDNGFLLTGDLFDPVVDRAVWGHIMTVKDTWLDMPRFQGWRVSSSVNQPDHLVRLDLHSDDRLDNSHAPRSFELPAVPSPLRVLTVSELDAFAVLAADGMPVLDATLAAQRL